MRAVDGHRHASVEERANVGTKGAPAFRNARRWRSTERRNLGTDAAIYARAKLGTREAKLRMRARRYLCRGETGGPRRNVIEKGARAGIVRAHASNERRSWAKAGRAGR